MAQVARVIHLDSPVNFRCQTVYALRFTKNSSGRRKLSRGRPCPAADGFVRRDQPVFLALHCISTFPQVGSSAPGPRRPRDTRPDPIRLRIAMSSDMPLKTSYRPMTIIVAATMKNGIGVNGGLPWRLPGEMKYFARGQSRWRFLLIL